MLTMPGAIQRVPPVLAAERVSVLRRPVFRIRHSSSFWARGADAAKALSSPPPVVIA
ncbi:hypothetical protein [Streptomyces sp. NPDC007172]|uniref:hypothetical protein n=1 Tax=Streptomyces sp. NPDC007172 TaxID=3364776 RepID=UPI00369F4BE7